MAAQMRGAAGVFAGVFDVDDQAGEVFEEDFGSETGVTAGAAGGNDKVRVLAQKRGYGGEGLIANSRNIAGEVEIILERSGDCCGLLVDLLQHVVAEAARL